MSNLEKDFRKKMAKVCRNCTGRTIDVYVRNTLRLAKLLDKESIPGKGAWLTSEPLLKAFDKLDLNKRRLLATAAVKSLDAYGIKRSAKWGERLATAAEEYDTKRDKRERSEKEKARWPSKGFDSLRRAAKMQKQQIGPSLRAKKHTVKTLFQIQKWALLVLYSEHALRLDWADVLLKKPDETEHNFIFKYPRKGWILTLRRYKTAKSRGTTTLKMSRSASMVLTKLVPIVKAVTTHGYLLSNSSGDRLSRNGLSKLLTRITERLLGNKGFSATMIRVLKATKFSKTLEKSSELAKEMMHSQEQNYRYSRRDAD